MKAVVVNAYGGPEVLKIKEVVKPSPKENEVLIRIKATSVTAASTFMREGIPKFGRLFLGLFRPKVKTPGTDLSGVIEAVGAKVNKFKVGEEVIAETGMSCGAYAEYICLKEEELIIKKPETLSFKESTAILDGGCTAIAFLTDVFQVKKGHKVLINGASGSIGLAAIQLVKYFGGEVTAVCSGRNKELVRSVGAKRVCDYTKEDVYELSEKFDLVFDTVGKLSFRKSKKLLVDKGVFITPVLTGKVLVQMISSSLFGGKRLKFDATGMRKHGVRLRDLKKVISLLENGELKSVIDKEYSLEDVQEAHRYVDTGRKRGNVVLVNKF